jgi:hypothetical protein
MENPYDKRATIENVREKYGSVKAFCQAAEISRRSFYRTLDEGWGLRRRVSGARSAIERLRSEGLLVEAAESSVQGRESSVN